jgi:hypothetical protein
MKMFVILNILYMKVTHDFFNAFLKIRAKNEFFPDLKNRLTYNFDPFW